MSDMDSSGLESALGAAFGEAPQEAPVAKAPTPKAPAPRAVPQQAAPAEEPFVDPEVDPAELLPDEPEPVEAKVEAEPEFEIEIEPGKPEVLPLAKLKELATRGAKAGRGFEENARVREALQAHVQNVQFEQQFQQAVAQDIAQIHALDNQLQGFEKIDWAALFDTDPFNGLKLKEQRDQLREQRAAAVHGYEAKRQQFGEHVQQHKARLLATETEALLAKVPAWRNAEKAAQEKGEIGSVLTSYYGFTAQEVSGLMDHRHLLVARDAAAYRKLLANKDARVKQAREAPAVAKPGSAATQTNGRVEFNKARAKVRELGTKGNHQAQESLMTQMLDRAFK